VIAPPSKAPERTPEETAAPQPGLSDLLAEAKREI
jgi:hypothetical protein